MSTLKTSTDALLWSAITTADKTWIVKRCGQPVVAPYWIIWDNAAAPRPAREGQ